MDLHAFGLLLLSTPVWANSGAPTPPSCGLAQKLPSLTFRPMAPESIIEASRLSMRTPVFKIKSAQETQVIRFPFSSGADLESETFASAFFRSQPATEATPVILLEGKEAEEMISSLNSRLPAKDQQSLKHAKITVARFEKGTLGQAVLMERSGYLARTGVPHQQDSVMLARALPSKLMTQVADYWATCLLLFITDCHAGNWIAADRVTAVDQAHGRIWKKAEKSLLEQGYQDPFSPVPNGKVTRPDVLKTILSSTSPELRESLQALTAGKLREIASRSSYAISEQEIQAILGQAQRILAEIRPR